MQIKSIRAWHDRSGKKRFIRLYSVWRGMKGRCKSPRMRKYYSDKGVYVCRQWSCFETFREWSINNGYRKGLTIDRIDNDGIYEPKNCRWATLKEQRQNHGSGQYTSKNRGEDNGRAKITRHDANSIVSDIRTQAAIAKHYGISCTTVSNIKSGRRWL
jgi:hypothetical protein